ncbi:hypothetical protein COCON_G00067600 [Conger conger]|uniref:Uncharacterized protein n=1 Tax=Conger conger TaxID=82655 RepID=A0A9Q1I3E0_CONCO|nr:hypothetical protein COCON_G00067600 [Conger conger]
MFSSISLLAKCDEALATPLSQNAFTSSSVFSSSYAPVYAKLNKRGGNTSPRSPANVPRHCESRPHRMQALAWHALTHTPSPRLSSRRNSRRFLTQWQPVPDYHVTGRR